MVTLPDHKEVRPRLGTEGDTENTGGRSTPIVPDSDDARRLARGVLAELDDLANVVDGTFVVVVEHPGAKYRRRCFLSAASAQRSARAAQARGLNSTVYMAELKPLWRITGGEAG